MRPCGGRRNIGTRRSTAFPPAGAKAGVFGSLLGIGLQHGPSRVAVCPFESWLVVLPIELGLEQEIRCRIAPNGAERKSAECRLVRLISGNKELAQSLRPTGQD